MNCVLSIKDCSCGSRDIIETKRYAELRCYQLNNPTTNLESLKHLRSKFDHFFTWTAVGSNAPKIFKTKKNL